MFDVHAEFDTPKRQRTDLGEMGLTRAGSLTFSQKGSTQSVGLGTPVRTLSIRVGCDRMARPPFAREDGGGKGWEGASAQAPLEIAAAYPTLTTKHPAETCDFPDTTVDGDGHLLRIEL